MVYQLLGLGQLDMKKETLVLEDTRVISDTSQQSLFSYTDVDQCQFYYNKIPLTTEIESDTPHHPRECCMVFVKQDSEKNDKSKYN